MSARPVGVPLTPADLKASILAVNHWWDRLDRLGVQRDVPMVDLWRLMQFSAEHAECLRVMPPIAART